MLREQAVHLVAVVVPGEVDDHDVLPVGAAQPEVVGGGGAQLAHDEVRLNLRGQAAHRVERGRRMLARDEVLGLDLLAEGRLRVEPEVRQPQHPRSWHTPELGDVVALAQRRAGAEDPPAVEQLVGHRVVVLIEARLHPHVADAVVVPPREHRHAVAGAGDGVEVGERGIPRDSFVDVLPQPIRGLDVEIERDDDPERADPDRERGEVGVAAAHLVQVAVGADVAERAHGRRQHAVGVARAVGAGGRRAADRDVRQRAEVVQRPALLVEQQGELAVARARADGGVALVGVQREPGLEAGEIDERAGRVGQVGERVPRAERVHEPGLAHETLHVVDRLRGLDARRGVLVRSGPVA